MIGSLMPWGAGDCYSRDPGMAMLPVLLTAEALLIVPYFKGAEGVPFRLAALGAMCCGIGVAVFVAFDISDVNRIPFADCISDPPAGVERRGSPAVGLYVTLAGAVLLALGSLTTALARPRPRCIGPRPRVPAH